MQVYGKTEIGYRRSTNQDFYECGTFPDGSVWMIVCDGMGGANAGNVASMIAARHIRESLVARYAASMAPGAIETLLTRSLEEANEKVYALSCSEPSYFGMGTTVVAAIVRENCAYLVHVGDSRAYRIGKSEAQQLTVDHSMVQELVELGRLSPEEARVHPKRNIITRAIGVREEVDVEYDFTPLEKDDILLLCTDGLSNTVREEQMTALRQGRGLEEFAEELIAQALSDGGTDNITVCAAQI